MVARSDCFRCGDGASPITITTRRPPSKPSALRRRHSSAPVMATRTPIGVKSREIRFQRTHPGAERVGRGAATANALANSLAVLIRSPRHLLDRHSCAGKSLASWRSRNPSYWRHSAFLIWLSRPAAPSLAGRCLHHRRKCSPAPATGFCIGKEQTSVSPSYPNLLNLKISSDLCCGLDKLRSCSARNTLL